MARMKWIKKKSIDFSRFNFIGRIIVEMSSVSWRGDGVQRIESQNPSGTNIIYMWVRASVIISVLLYLFEIICMCVCAWHGYWHTLKRKCN